MVEDMVGYMKFKGQFDEGMDEDEYRRMMTESMARGADFSRKVEIAGKVSLWVTATIGSFILLASFVAVFALFMPWLDLWALVISAAYVILFFGLQAESDKMAEGFT